MTQMPEWTELPNGVFYWVDTSEEEWRMRLRYKKWVASCQVDTFWLLAVDPQEIWDTLYSRSEEFKYYVDSGRVS